MILALVRAFVKTLLVGVLCDSWIDSTAQQMKLSTPKKPIS